MALSWEYRGKSVEGLPTTKEVITLCTEKGPRSNCFAYPPNASPVAFIKYGSVVPLGEVRTQLYVSQAFQKMKDHDPAIRVPEIYHAFELQNLRYVVMEYIDGLSVDSALQSASSPEDKDRIRVQVATAITELMRVPVPSGQRPGPVGGGFIRNHFFKDSEAPVEYESVGALQRNINAVLRKTEFQVNFSEERMCLCYSDISEGNFLLTNAGQVCVIDFADASFLPNSLMSFVMESRMKPLVSSITEKVSPRNRPT